MVAPIRVLIVDDSSFMRYTIAKHLEADPDITVIGSAQNGLDALAKIPVLKPDVVTLDVEMPHMDGLTALQLIMKDCPTPVIMLSSLTQRGTRTTIQALLRGAVDFVAKPTASTDMRTVIQDLALKVKMIASVKPGISKGRHSKPQDLPAVQTAATSTNETKSKPSSFRQGDPVIVIGTSTGGPRALQQVLSDLPSGLSAALIIVQHMPPGFTRSLAQRLNEASGLTVREAIDGDYLARDLALLAPGDFHLRIKSKNLVSLDRGPRRHHVRPAVDVTMESVAELHKSRVIGVILTGMGSDGVEGAGVIKAAGGRVIAEHESTSVVYGMPRSVVEAGLADQVIPLPEIAPLLVELVKNGTVRV